MKKIIILIAMLLAAITSIYAQDSTTVDTSLSAREVYVDIKEGFQQLITTLEGPAKHTYKLYVRQHVASGWTYIIGSIFFFIISIIALKMGIKYINHDDYNDEDWPLVLATIGGIMAILSFICIIGIFAGNSLMEIINPEYYAIQDIINAFK